MALFCRPTRSNLSASVFLFGHVLIFTGPHVHYVAYNWLFRAYEVPYGSVLEFVSRTRKTDRQTA